MSTQFSLLLLIAVLSFASVPSSYASDLDEKCNAIELVQGNDAYNHLVCRAIRALNDGDYKSAITLFNKASTEVLFELPNYKLFPKLAYAYFKSGDTEKAQIYIEKSKLALSLTVGIMHCQEINSSFYVAQFASARVDSPVNSDIAKIMCGAAYDDVYAGRTLEGTVMDAKLIDYYLMVSKQIKEKGAKPGV